MRQAVFLGFAVWLAHWSGLCADEEGLIGHWRFDTPAPEAADLSGHGHAARLAGGKIVREGGAAVLALDGAQQIVIPSTPELNLCRNFSIEARVRFDRLREGHTLIFKDNQYSIRVDWTSEGRKISSSSTPIGSGSRGSVPWCPSQAGGTTSWQRGTAARRYSGSMANLSRPFARAVSLCPMTARW